jgi:hypothetical protein
MFTTFLFFYLFEKLQSLSIPVKNNRKLTFNCSIFVKLFRFVYIIFAIYYVAQSMYSTFQKYKEGRIVLSITEKDYHQHMYPSITFCTKFRNEQNSALAPYFDVLFEGVNKSGKQI